MVRPPFYVNGTSLRLGCHFIVEVHTFAVWNEGRFVVRGHSGIEFYAIMGNQFFGNIELPSASGLRVEMKAMPGRRDAMGRISTFHSN